MVILIRKARGTASGGGRCLGQEGRWDGPASGESVIASRTFGTSGDMARAIDRAAQHAPDQDAVCVRHSQPIQASPMRQRLFVQEQRTNTGAERSGRSGKVVI